MTISRGETKEVVVGPVTCSRCGIRYEENPGTLNLLVPGKKVVRICAACICEVCGVVPEDTDKGDNRVLSGE